MPAHHTPQSDTYLEQRAIVHQLLRDDHTERWTAKQLQRATADPRDAITDALAELQAAGVIWRLDDYVGAAPCTRCLFALNLIGI